MASTAADMTLETSAYLGSICNVAFHGNVFATVHYNVLPASLRSSARCKSQFGSTFTLDMKDIESGIGHVIFHFLYSGEYRCLKSSNCSDMDVTIYELKLAFKVYAASRSLELKTLQALTEDEILKLSDQLSFPLVVCVIKSSETWFVMFPRYAEYLQSHLFSLMVDSWSQGQASTSILSNLETPNTFSMVILKTLLVFGRIAAGNAHDVDGEHNKTESSDPQSLPDQAPETSRAKEDIAILRTKEKQALEIIKVCEEISILQRKKESEIGELGKTGQRLAVLEEQIATYKQEHNQEQIEDQSGEVLEGKDEQDTIQPTHIDKEPTEIKVEQDTQTEEVVPSCPGEDSRVEVGSSSSEVSGSVLDWEHVLRTDIRHSFWVPSASGSVDFLSSSDGQVTPSNSESLP